MPFRVEDFHDLVRLIEQRPEWRAELRRLVLSEELLELPDIVRNLAEQMVVLTARVDQLTARVDQLAEQMVVLTARVDELTARVDQLTARVDELTARVDQLTARVDQLAEQMVVLTARVDQLTARVDELTARVDQLTARVDQLAEQMVVLTARVDQLAAAQVATEERLSRVEEALLQLTRRVDLLDERVADLRGDFLERRYERHAGAYFSPLVRRVRPVDPDELDDLLDEGLEARRLTEQETREVRRADLILRGRRPENGEPHYLIVEVSAGIGASDVRRASRRASLLGRLRPALAVVAGEFVTRDARELAASLGVTIVTDGRREEADGLSAPPAAEG